MQQKTETEESDVVLFNVSGDFHVHMSHISPYPAQDSSSVCLCVLFIICYYFL